MSTHPLSAPAPSHSTHTRALGARLAAFARTEHAIVAAALAAVAVHIVDENFVQTNPGTSPGDHLASGLIPLGVLAALAVVYPRLRAGVRATLALTLGALAIAFGAPSAYYLVDGQAAGSDYSGPLALAGGVVLLITGVAVLWRARRRDESRRRRYLLRATSFVAVVVLTPVLFSYVVFPVGLSYVYSHVGGKALTPELGVPYETVRFPATDGIELAATYVPSKNRAAVVLFPGASRSDEARMLIRHGYGVLMVEPRGQGRSGGDNNRWANDRDLLGAAAYLASRPDVDSHRIGGMGFSNGGELLLEAAAQSEAYSAVVSEGAGGRMGEEDLSGIEKYITAPQLAMLTAGLTVFQNHRPPPPIVDRIGLIAPRPVFLIYADPGMGAENTRQPLYYAAAGKPKQLWNVPGSKHTGGLDARPAEYERRVVDFLDRSLLG